MPLRGGLRVVAIAALVAATGVLLSAPQIGFGLEEESGLQWLFRLRGPRPAPTEAVVVRFDRDTFARLRTLPDDPAAWPQPLAGCAAHQGGIEGLDDAVRLDRLPRGVIACLVEQLTLRGAAVIAFDISFRRDPDREAGVAALAEALRTNGNVILLGLALRQLGPTVQADWQDRPHPLLAEAAIATAPLTLPRGSSQIHQFWAFNPALAEPTQLPVRALEVMSLPALTRLAHATQEPMPLSAHRAELLTRFTGWYRAQVAADGGLSGAELAALPPAEVQALRALARVYRGPEAYYISFYGTPGTILSYSAADLLVPDRADAIPADELRGRIVFVGFQELDIPQAEDSFPTAFRAAGGVDLAGVEIAATAFGNLLHDHTLRALPEGWRLTLMAAFGFVLTLASCLGTVWRGMALTIALGGGYFALAVSAPSVVTEFVNRHFTMLDRCVEAEGGTLAQFIGDSVMSFWGAPDPQPDHAVRACRAALAIGAALAAENSKRAAEGLAPVRMRIGINTGMVTAGNVGAPGRSNYGIVGDTVNTTQRIEQLAKLICPDQPTAAILVSARTRALAGSAFTFHEAGAHEVRGRSHAVMIYRLLDASSVVPAAATTPAFLRRDPARGAG